MIPRPFRFLCRDAFPRLAATLVLLAVLLAACGGQTGDAGPQALPLWTAEQDLRIGAVDDPDYAFGSVAGLTVDPDGVIYSLHPREPLIRRWTADGYPAGSVGRRGEGPGEYTNPRVMGWHPDTLWVFDGGNSRISFFDPAGGFLGDVNLTVDIGSREQALEGVYPARPSGFFGDGSIHSVTPGFSQAIMEGELTELAHVRTDVHGSELDTLIVRPIGQASVLGISYDDSGGVYTSQPFGDQVLVETTGDGLGLLVLERWAAEEAGIAEFRLTRIDLAGDTLYSQSYPYEPVPLPQASVDSAVAATAESLHDFVGERTGIPLGQWRQRVERAIYTPRFHTPIGELVAGRDGTTWLALNPEDSEGPTWLILAEDGTTLGRIRLPEIQVLAADRETIWGIQRDELDVEYIVRYRVRGDDDIAG